MLYPHTDRLNEGHLAEADEARRFHLLSYLVSNAAAAEILSMENSAEMVQLLPTTRARIDMVDVARSAGEHTLVLRALGGRLGIGAGRGLVEPCWHGIRRHVRSAIARDDVAACLILQDVICGTATITIYETLLSAGGLDSRAAAVVTSILADAFERLEAGTWQLRTLLSRDSEGTIDALRWSHHRAMRDLHDEVNRSCAELCDDGACDPAAVTYIARDVETLKQRSAQRYAETLGALFDPAVVHPLIAGLSSYGGRGRQADAEEARSGYGATPQGHSG